MQKDLGDFNNLNFDIYFDSKDLEALKSHI